MPVLESTREIFEEVIIRAEELEKSRFAQILPEKKRLAIRFTTDEVTQSFAGAWPDKETAAKGVSRVLCK